MLLKEKNVNVVVNDEVMTAYIGGEIDHHNASSVRRKIDSELEIRRPRELVLDLAGVNFMDSSGLGLILGRYTKAADLGISFRVEHPTPATLKILDLVGGDRMITIIK